MQSVAVIAAAIVVGLVIVAVVVRSAIADRLGEVNARLDGQQALTKDRLDALHRTISEAASRLDQSRQELASGLVDVRKALGNVKVRGVWGEYQLAGILEQFLGPDQYVANFAPSPQSQERVEFAVKYPGRDAGGEPLYLPIDAKFPQEDFQRLVDASESGQAEQVRIARDGLLRTIRLQARDIRDKYIRPPRTTDFAVMFLPTESLFAEVVREAGIVSDLQREYRINIAGPTTLAALLTSLRVGFQSLAIEQRASEVRNVLAAVKGEFEKFGAVLERMKKHVGSLSSSIESAETRTRAMQRKLKDVESLSGDQARELLELPAAEHEGQEPFGE